MATTRSALTEGDIRTLVKGATPDERAAAAEKLCQSMDRAPLTEDDRALAGEILRIMATDAAELVRRTLAFTLRASPIVPRDVALKLARDVETVSLPLLSSSPAFTDEDLAEVVRLGGPVRQLAIAKRPKLGRKVADALAEHGSERSVALACSNEQADFSETGLATVVARFEQSERVLAAVAFRAALPLSITERLINLVGEEVRKHLVETYALDPEAALQVALDTTERASIDLIDEAGRAADMRSFVAHLAVSGRLTPSLLLRGVAQGQITFFEWGLAELAGVPHHRTWLMIHDAGPLGLKAIYDRAGLPARLYPAFRAAVDTYHSLEHEAAAQDRAGFQEKMLERFLTQPQPAGREDVDYLLDRMDQLSDVRRREVVTA